MGEANQPHLATRFRAVVTSGPTGGEENVTWEATGQVTSARLEPVSVDEIQSQDQTVAVGEYQLALPIGAVADPRDHFTVEGVGINDALWLREVEVVGTPGPHTWESERIVRVLPLGPPQVTHRLHLTSNLSPQSLMG